MNLKEFLKLVTMDGKVQYARINHNNSVSMTDATNSLLIYALSKVSFGLSQDLCIGDTGQLLKILTVLGDSPQIEVKETSVVLSNSGSKFVVELLASCPNYVEEGTKSLNAILKKCLTTVVVDGGLLTKMSDALSLYKKPIVAFYQEGKGIFLCLADLSFSDTKQMAKQYATIQIVGNPVKQLKSPFEVDVNWHNGMFFLDVLKALVGMGDISLKLSFEKTPFIVIGKTTEVSVYFCVAPTLLMEK